MQRDLEILITVWRLNCEYLQRQSDVNNTVGYTERD
jgi:hypothetical protein